MGKLLPNGRKKNECMPKGIRLLDERYSKLAGVAIPSLREVVPHFQRQSILENLKKLTMEMYYEYVGSGGTIQRNVRKSLKLKSNFDGQENIKWEPATHRFEFKGIDGATREVTVAEYFKEKYGIILQYPNVCVTWDGMVVAIFLIRLLTLCFFLTDAVRSQYICYNTKSSFHNLLVLF